MFDIGFWELVVVAVVALLVVGPKELPTMIRTAGAVVGKMRRFVREAKADLDEEIHKVDELKRLIAKEAGIADLHKDIDSDQLNIPINYSSSRPEVEGETQAKTTPGKHVVKQPQGSSEQSQPPHGTSKE